MTNSNKNNTNKITNPENIDIEYITNINNKLGVDIKQQLERNLQLYPEEKNCVSAGKDFYQRDTKLHSLALKPWLDMQSAANKDNINLFICSAFRSYDYQNKLIQRKLDQGKDINQIISVLAPPGFSEHHTGCAIDIITSSMKELDQSFDQTSAFQWLEKYAKDFDFVMSYPMGNSYGIIYEPWHWCYRL